MKKNTAGQEQASPTVQCYLCGRTVTRHYITERIEPRLATRYHGKRVQICIYCAEEWDEEFPDTKVPVETIPPIEEENVIPSEAAEPEAPEAPVETPLTKRQAERLAWYSNVTPIQGYSVKSAILRDDALGAVAHEADRMGLSYGYYIARQEAARRAAEEAEP